MKRSNLFISLGLSLALIAAGIYFLYDLGIGACYGQTGWQTMFRSGRARMIGFNGGMDMGIVMLLFWGVIIVAIALLVFGGISKGRLKHVSWAGRADDALEILKQRYARGEIDRDEYEIKRRDLDVQS
jgi:putative membrane protein